METESQPPKEREDPGLISAALNSFVEAFNLAKEISNNTPAKAVFGTDSVPLAMIRDMMINKVDYAELGLACTDVCVALKWGLDAKSEDDLNDSVREAIKQLRAAMEEIQGWIAKQGKRNTILQHLHAKSDKERIAAWRLDLIRVVQVFDTEFVINAHTTVSRTHTVVSGTRTIVHGQEGNDNKVSPRASGESPPPPPRTFFVHDGLIKQTMNLAKNLHPIALIGAGGIGKTSIVLTILHHDRIKQRFGHGRPIPGLAYSFPPPALWRDWCRGRKP